MVSKASLGTSAFHDTPSNQWHTLAPDQALQLLESRPQGLTVSEVTERQQTYGPNELQEGATRSPLEIFWDQFKNIMLLMLIAVALVSLVLDLQEGGFPKDAIAIFAIVLLNGALGYLQESKAEKALAALKNMTSPRVRVLRQGKRAGSGREMPWCQGISCCWKQGFKCPPMVGCLNARICRCGKQP
jgi:Ca2+-transporting ATPase